MGQEMSAINQHKRSPIVRNGRYAWVVVGYLAVAYAFSFIDRQIINLLIDPIKHDLGATDVQMSLLQGGAFIIAYMVFTPIFGRLVDVSNRRNVVISGVITWSAFTVLCGLSTSLDMLFFARAGLGAAEAVLAPAAFSIVSDYFTKDRLPRAMSVFLIGPYMGTGFALVFGGLVIASAESLKVAIPVLANFQPWQITLIFVGAPGIVYGFVLLAVREPPRQTISGPGLDERRYSLSDVARFMWDGRDFYIRFTATGALILGIMYSIPAWMPSTLIRSFGVTPGQVGLQFGALLVIMGPLGVVTGPFVEAWLRKRGHKSAVVLCMIIAAASLAPLCALIPFAPNYQTALIVASLITFLCSFPQSLTATALQVATPNRMRGVVMAANGLILAGFGLGIVPTIVASVTDFVFHDAARVRESLAIVCASSATLAVFLGWSSLAPYRRILAAEEAAVEALGGTSPSGFPQNIG